MVARLSLTSTAILLLLSTEASAQCQLFAQAAPKGEGCYLAEEEVRWESLVGVSLSPQGITKIAGGSNWNAGAATKNTVAPGGYFYTVVDETNTSRIIGLSSTNPDAGFTSIQYAFSLQANGILAIVESGSNRGTFGAYATGDTLKIASEAGSIKYYHNNQLIFVRANAPIGNLLVDASLFTVGATIKHVHVVNPFDGSFNATHEQPGTGPSYQWRLNGAPVGSDSPSYTNHTLNPGDVVTCDLTPGTGSCAEGVQISNLIRIRFVTNKIQEHFYITAQATTSGCATYVEDAIWKQSDMVNVASSGSNLRKIQSNGNWDGGAFSVNAVHNNGYFEFTNAGSLRKAIGLSINNPNAGLNNILYAFYFEGNGDLNIYESGIDRGTFGNHSVGDIYRIEVFQGSVRYYKNGVHIYTSVAMVSSPLKADVSLRDVNAQVVNPVICNHTNGTFQAFASNAGPSPTYQWQLNGADVGTGTATYVNTNLNQGDVISCILYPDFDGCNGTGYQSNEIEKRDAERFDNLELLATAVVNQNGFAHAFEEVLWRQSSLLNVVQENNELLKVSSNNTWNGNAASLNRVQNNGYFQFTVSETNRRRMVGLSHTDASASYLTIQYGFDLNVNGTLGIYESGHNRGLFGTFSSGDTLSIGVENNAIRYYRNGALVYSSNIAPTLPLLVDVSIRDIGGTVTDARVVHITAGSFTVDASNAGSNPTYQWKLNGADVGTNSNTFSSTEIYNGDVLWCEVTPSIVGCTNLTFASNQILISRPDVITIWTGAVSTVWHLGANWTEGVPNQFVRAIIPQGTPNSPYISDISSVKSLQIDAGASVEMGATSLLVYRNLENEGNFIAGTGTVVFRGMNPSVIQGVITTFNKLTIFKELAEPAVALNQHIQIADETIFLNGIIDATTHEVIYLNGADSREGLDASHVEGTCRKIGNQAFRFPVGKNGIYAPVSISAPSLPTDEFTARYEDDDPENAGYITSDRDAALETLSRCEYWIVEREVGTASVSVTLSYENIRSCGVTLPEELRVARWDGNFWQNHGYLTHDGDAGAGTVTSATPIFSFSPFTLGSGSSANPLPITLLSFEVAPSGSKVDVKWVTGSEQHNDYFAVERSSDGSSFAQIGAVPGAGYSNTAQSYNYSDLNPLQGTSYYRITQVDFDGTKKSYPALSVFMESGFAPTLFPNPNKGEFRISLPHSEGMSILRLISQEGKVVWQGQSPAGIVEPQIRHLSPGFYVMEILHNGQADRIKVVVQ